MKVSIDAAGRLVIPKAFRDLLGLEPGATVDISQYGAGLQLIPVTRTARVRAVRGAVVAESDTTITDEDVFALIDGGRR